MHIEGTSIKWRLFSSRKKGSGQDLGHLCQQMLWLVSHNQHTLEPTLALVDCRGQVEASNYTSQNQAREAAANLGCQQLHIVCCATKLMLLSGVGRTSLNLWPPSVPPKVYRRGPAPVAAKDTAVSAETCHLTEQHSVQSLTCYDSSMAICKLRPCSSCKLPCTYPVGRVNRDQFLTCLCPRLSRGCNPPDKVQLS